MILNAVLFGHGSHEASWRAPVASPAAPLTLAHWTQCARLAEDAGFDGVFLGDILCLQDHPEHHPSESLDPFMVLSVMAAVTTRIRLTGTASTSFNHPFHLARRILTLHHLSGGRAGWNIVTSSYPQEAGNFGWDEMPATAERYAMADDVVRAVLALWNAWDGVARVGDKATGRYLSQAPAHVRTTGRYGRIDGAVNLGPVPYDRPLLAQAGSSAEGVAFAGHHADHVFTVQSDMNSTVAFRARIRQTAAAAGRDPDTVKVLPGVVPFIGETLAEAEAQLQTLTDLAGLDHLLAKLARFTGLAVQDMALDAPLSIRPEDLPGNRFSNSRARLLVAHARVAGLTMRQLAARFAAGRGHLLLVGTGPQIAATMQTWLDAGAADGFNVMVPELPHGIADFGAHVLPHLRRHAP